MLPPFQRVMDENRRNVWRFLVAMVGPQEAEDCFQETFLAALRAYPRLRDASNLRGWIFTIARSKAMDSHRARRRRPAPVGRAPDGAAPVGSNGFDPELADAVRTLPPKQRAAVVHRFVNDLTYRDIAALMDTTQAAARQNVSEGIRRLREVVKA